MKIVKILHILLALTIFTIPLITTPLFVFSFTPSKTFLFFILTEIALGLWIYLIWTHREYRPKKHSLLISGIVFLSLYTLAGLFGADPNNSFWSSLSRMSGLITLYHVGIFILILGTVVRNSKTWKIMLRASVLSAAIIAIVSYFEPYGFNLMQLSTHNGSLVGNSSYAGPYLLANVFFALYLAQTTSSTKEKVSTLACALAIILSPLLFSLKEIPHLLDSPVSLLGNARAASGALIIGIILYGIVLLPYKKIKFLLGVGLGFTLITAITLSFIPSSPVRNILENQGVGSRIVWWDSAYEAIREKPILGWGPENFNYAWYRHFNPEIFQEQYGLGQEADSDKPHNTYIALAVTGGLTSLLAYLCIIFVTYRSFSSDPRSYAAWIAGFTALALHNILFFDTISSLLVTGIILAFALSRPANEVSKPEHPLHPPALLTSTLIPIILLFVCVVLPLHAHLRVKNILENPGDADYALALESFAHNTSATTYLLEKTWTEFPQNRGAATFQKHIKELSSALESRIDEHNTNYRINSMYVRLIFAHAITTGDPRVLENMPDKINHLKVLSPNNPEPYWIEAQYALSRGERAAAIELLETAQKKFPTVPQTSEFIELIQTTDKTPLII